MSKPAPIPATLLEICIASPHDAMIAEAAGADRVELNSALSLGGLTPSQATIQQTLYAVSIPVITMARPREAGFCYSESEFQTLLVDIQCQIDLGVHGVAFGVLDNNGQIDKQRCKEVVNLVDGRVQTVFHRAFDLVDDPANALETLIDMGVQRVMTSGSANTAWQGRKTIRELVRQADSRIEILAAGGIRSDHVSDLVKHCGLRQLHAGLGAAVMDSSYCREGQVNFYGQPPKNAGHFRQSCSESILEMKRLLTVR